MQYPLLLFHSKKVKIRWQNFTTAIQNPFQQILLNFLPSYFGRTDGTIFDKLPAASSDPQTTIRVTNEQLSNKYGYERCGAAFIAVPFMRPCHHPTTNIKWEFPSSLDSEPSALRCESDAPYAKWHHHSWWRRSPVTGLRLPVRVEVIFVVLVTRSIQRTGKRGWERQGEERESLWAAVYQVDMWTERSVSWRLRQRSPWRRSFTSLTVSVSFEVLIFQTRHSGHPSVCPYIYLSGSSRPTKFRKIAYLGLSLQFVHTFQISLKSDRRDLATFLTKAVCTCSWNRLLCKWAVSRGRRKSWLHEYKSRGWLISRLFRSIDSNRL